jgi:redox-sensitive bicupin YhaK (pirin superfamily)
VRRLTPGERTTLPPAPHLYLHVVRGDLRLNTETLHPGDAARITEAEPLEAEALTATEVLLWAMT